MKDFTVTVVEGKISHYKKIAALRDTGARTVDKPKREEYGRIMAFGYREATAEELALTPLVVGADSLSPDQIRFLNTYLVLGGIRHAAKASKINSFYHYQWLDTDSAYQAAFTRARTIFEDLSTEGIKKRAISGWLEPLSYKGKRTGDKLRRYSDSLSLGYMKAVDPRWRDGTQINIGPAKMTLEIIDSQADVSHGTMPGEGEEITITASKPNEVSTDITPQIPNKSE